MVDLSKCESPLEVKLGEALVVAMGEALVPSEGWGGNGIIGALPGWSTVFASQPNFGWCRPDFMLVSVASQTFADMGWSDPPECLNALVIEVDGHDFHERTKAQARRDRSRDRAMLARGWVPVRFTGQEVHENADVCAEQVMEMFITRQRKVLDDAFSAYLEWYAKQLDTPRVGAVVCYRDQGAAE